MQLPRRMTLVAALALTATASQALDLGDWLRVEGFGTLAAYAADDAVATAHADARNPKGSRDGRWRADGDSLASLQLTLNPNGELRGVAQWLAKDDLARRFAPRTEWFYVSWDTAPGWNLQLGRLVLPVFMLSDTRNVAFAQTAARPPTVLYGLNPISHLDGGSATWRLPAWGGHLGVDATLGRSSVKVAVGELDLQRIAGLNARWTHGGTSLRMGHSVYRSTVRAPVIELALSALNSGSTGCTNCASVLPERVPSADFKGSITALGAVQELGPWQFQAEYAYRHSNTALIIEASAWYAMAAYRWRALTPYLVLGRLRTHEAPLDLRTAPGAGSEAAAANAAFERFLLSRGDRRSLQLGLRWDLRENMALKFQLERIKVDRDPVFGSTAIISIPLPPPVGSYVGPAFDGRLNMVSLNLDFVF